LRLSPADIALPAELPEERKAKWGELFRYPRSLATAVLTGLSQTGVVGLALWG
jgi:hypothetical protein